MLCRIFLFLFCSLFLWSCQPSEIVIFVDGDHFAMDMEKKMIVCQVDLTPYANHDSYGKVTINLADRVEWELAETPTQLSAAQSYTITNHDLVFELFFTNFPLIQIDATKGIQQDTKSLATFAYAHDTLLIQSKIGVELRGKTSLNFPKKNYDIEFWTDAVGEKTQSFQLAGLRKDDDWVLDAIYRESLRFNAYLAHKLWLKIHTLHYQEKEANAKSGADVSYAEVFINESYRGVFMLSEQVDRKQLKIKKIDKKTIEGELFKGENYSQAVSFKSARIKPDNSSVIWNGYKMKYPKSKDTIDWSSLYDFVKLVAETTDVKFKSVADKYFDLDNAIDYYIFINVCSAMDNMGKNIYTARYDKDTPYFYIPWDLDGTWGFHWRGEPLKNKEVIYTNKLFQRLIAQNPAGFRQRLSQRWRDLRTDILSLSTLTNDIEAAHALMLSNNVYEKEAAAWADYKVPTDEKAYLLSYLEQRLLFLDKHFKKIGVSK